MIASACLLARMADSVYCLHLPTYQFKYNINYIKEQFVIFSYLMLLAHCFNREGASEVMTRGFDPGIPDV